MSHIIAHVHGFAVSLFGRYYEIFAILAIAIIPPPTPPQVNMWPLPSVA